MQLRARRWCARVYLCLMCVITSVQDEIHALLLAFAEAGATVIRLKGGDPYVFGRGGEEVQYLAARGIQVHCVPGITAASGKAQSMHPWPHAQHHPDLASAQGVSLQYCVCARTCSRVCVCVCVRGPQVSVLSLVSP